MPLGLTSRWEFDVARFAALQLRRTVRDLRERLVAEGDPINYCFILGELALAELQLDQCSVQVGEGKVPWRFVLRERTRK